MPATPTYGFRYPAVTDPPNVSLDVQHLALDVEAKFATVDATLAAPAIGGEWIASGAQTMFAASNKVSMATASIAPNGITFNGTDTWTIVTPGVYSLYGQLRMAGAITGELLFGATTYSDATHILPGLSVLTTFGDFWVSGSVYLNAGTQFCFYFYDNGGTLATAYATRPAKVKIWKVA